MNGRLKALMFVVAVAGVSVLACLLTGHWMTRVRAAEDPHAWIHRQLGMTEEQERLIAPAEQRLEERRRHLIEVIQLANMELAEAMLDSEGPSPRVAAAIEKIHEAQAELQQVTIEHVFEMRDALRPEQYDKLLNLTADALYATPQN